MPRIKHQLTPIAGTSYDIPEMTVVYKDVFDLDFLYFMIHEWLVENGWAPRDDKKFGEVLMVQRESAVGKEIFVKWRLNKDTYDPYWRFEMDVKYHILGLKDVEIVAKGKKIQVNAGECEVKIAPRLIYEKKKYEASPLLRLAKEIVLPLTFKKKKEEFWAKLYREGYLLQEAVKKYFKLETYFEITELQEFYEQTGGG